MKRLCTSIPESLVFLVFIPIPLRTPIECEPYSLDNAFTQFKFPKRWKGTQWLLSLPPLTSIRRLLSSEPLALSVFSWVSVDLFLVIHVYAAACIYLSFFRKQFLPLLLSPVLHIAPSFMHCTVLSSTVQTCMYSTVYPCFIHSVS